MGWHLGVPSQHAPRQPPSSRPLALNLSPSSPWTRLALPAPTPWLAHFVHSFTQEVSVERPYDAVLLCSPSLFRPHTDPNPPVWTLLSCPSTTHLCPFRAAISRCSGETPLVWSSAPGQPRMQTPSSTGLAGGTLAWSARTLLPQECDLPCPSLQGLVK